MKRRVFVAIPIPEEIRSGVIKWQEAHTDFWARWTKPENLHITLVPPWYVNDTELLQTSMIFKEALEDIKTFRINFDKILLGPPGRPPRLIWAEGNNPEEFIRLKELTEKTFLSSSTGFSVKEKRAAKLHLTVARFRPDSFKKPPDFREKINWSFEIKEINLMASELKRTGAEYTTLHKLEILNSKS